ncbi:TAT-variant-translocated molybdopterin oxidoreductase [Fulvivirgaceae bacterium BMA10]|uniref:TAT-variant-translocated molybdopterin oxidoreductase n=1 Tax=Splendidivirga corallicola TaxID=3051826 RepID=A0ABT8KS79_9BACT|nr:TAT-variant-translocated molybdopterin oxidoreductase [Fulvivirgaceae bacterium BMA10]
MKDNKKQYWKGLEELKNDPEFVKYADKEFPEYLPINNRSTEGDEAVGSSRRDFLKLMGFGVAAASLAACEAPIRKAIPYLNKPVDVDPGVANYYASAYVQGGDYCSVVVKTREGRPIKIEGNKLSKISQGGVSAQVEASVLSLYDDERLKHPYINGEKATWQDVDKEVIGKLNSVSGTGGKISIVSNTVLSPSTKAVVEEFKAKFSNVEHVIYDTYSALGIRKANEATFGKAIVPSYDFSKAQVIASFGADFLGTWISPIEFTKQYSKTRKISKGNAKMSRHYQFESNLSLTGANADYRSPTKPSQEGLAVAQLYNLIAAKAGVSGSAVKIDGVQHLEKAANDLWASRGKSLVVSGSNDSAVQAVVNGINQLLGNYGSTIDIDLPVNYRQGDDTQMNTFVESLKQGGVAAVIFLGSNPVYNHPKGGEIASALEKAKLKLSTASTMDETAALCDIVAPDHHYLESWNDASPRSGTYSLVQPVIRPLFDTRQAQESLLIWAGNNTEYYEYLRNYWNTNFYANQSSQIGFQSFWDKTLHDGIYEHKASVDTTDADDTVSSSDETVADISQAFAQIQKNYKADNTGIELALYQKVAIGDGSQANNPWLQEMPDPVTKATWDNYLTISQAMAAELGVAQKEGDTNLVNLTVGGQSYEVPVVIQPGQAKGTVGLALGYGRKNAGKVANEIGLDAYPFVTTLNGSISYNMSEGVTVEATGKSYQVARTQTHQTIMGRTILQEAYLPEYEKNPSAGRSFPKIATSTGKKSPYDVTLWKGHKYENHHWGLVVDLNSCTGCSACTISCQAENNVPVVGKEEVLNRREMHWIRIDRYYSSPEGASEYKDLEKAADNPEVTFQPMMCQHCNNAPCETVCPVAATTHSSEGLNQMTYNRCIGTRYCANNCPYKVRRFNWFKYHDNRQFADVNTSMNNNLGKMVLNPDVTVRSRGVMEKCSFCVQRIQAGKLEAKKEGRRPQDGEIDVACASSCPADALVFGDMNDPKSKISQMLKLDKTENGVKVGEERAYHVLEEISVKPNVSYLTKIRNKDVADKEA